MDYTYFRIAPASAAGKLIKLSTTAQKAAIAAVHEIGKTFLPQCGEMHIVGSDRGIIGFAPKDISWEKFKKLINWRLWVKEEDPNCAWIRPRQLRGKSNPDHALWEAWQARAAPIPWQQTCRGLVGMGDFCHGMQTWTAMLRLIGDTMILGVPYPATVGKMKPLFGGGDGFKLADGITPVPYEEAMGILYANFEEKG